MKKMKTTTNVMAKTNPNGFWLGRFSEKSRSLPLATIKYEQKTSDIKFKCFLKQISKAISFSDHLLKQNLKLFFQIIVDSKVAASKWPLVHKYPQPRARNLDGHSKMAK